MRRFIHFLQIALLLMLPVTVIAKETYTTRYFYHWEKKEGTPHPEDVILALEYKQDNSLYKVRIYCTTDEDKKTRVRFLPGFYVLEHPILPQDKVSENEYNLEFFPQAKMVYAQPVEIKYKEPEAPWKSGKYQTWRYTKTFHPNSFKYKMRLESDGTLTLKGHYYKDRKFFPMSEAQVSSLNRNTYDEKLLAANRTVNPIDDERARAASSIAKKNVQRTLRKDGKVYYEGEVSLYKNGQTLIEGKGKYYFSDGTVYEGDFVNGKRQGYGTIVWGDSTQWAGERYEGEWNDGWRTGQGTYTDAHGNISKGRWEKNILVEPESQTPEVATEIKNPPSGMAMLEFFASNGKLQIDFQEVETFVKQNAQGYKELMEKFHEDPLSLSNEEAAMLYYGFAFTKDYDPDHVDLIVAPTQLIKEGKLQEAFDVCQKELQKAPVSLSLLLRAALAAGMLKHPDAQKYSQKVAKIMTAIMSSGTGYSQDKAIKVIFISDEYAIFRDGMRFVLSQQDFIDSRYDRMTLETGNKGESIILWFDTYLVQQRRKGD